MTNWRLIDEAVKLVNEIFEAENIMESTKSITERALWWYNHSEIVDPEMLAAVVIIDQRDMTWAEMEQAKEFYFPSEPVWMNNFHVGEIEESLHDLDFLFDAEQEVM